MGSIEQWRIQEFANNVYHLSQQSDSRMWSQARHESMSSKRKFFDRLGSTSAQLRTTRHADTPNVAVDHSRRAVDLVDYNWGKLVDDVDVLRNINDPTSPYAKAMAMAFKRQKDESMIAAMLGNSIEGEAGGTSTALPTAQKIAAINSAGDALANLSVATLRHAKYKFDVQDIDPDLPRYMAISPSQLRNLLTETEVTSADYANVKALVEGKVNSFMGFEFIVTNLLDTEPDAVKFSVSTGEYSAGGTSGIANRRCLAWIPDGVIVATGIDMKARISERSDKNYSNQVYGEMSIGAARLEDVKVLYINCNE